MVTLADVRLDYQPLFRKGAPARTLLGGGKEPFCCNLLTGS